MDLSSKQCERIPRCGLNVNVSEPFWSAELISAPFDAYWRFDAFKVLVSHRRCRLRGFTDLVAFYLSNYCTDVKINSPEKVLQWKHKSPSCDVETPWNLMQDCTALLSPLHVVFMCRTLHKICVCCPLKKNKCTPKCMRTHNQNKRFWCLATTQSIPYLQEHTKPLREFEALTPSSGPLLIPSHHLPSLCYFFSPRTTSVKEQKKANVELLRDRDVRINH